MHHFLGSSIALVLFTSSLMAEYLMKKYAPLTEGADLAPKLTKDEVDKEMAPWKKEATELLSKFSSERSEEIIESMTAARVRLDPRLLEVTQITLFSLHPWPRETQKKSDPARLKEFEKLPAFHDYPILGQVDINNSSEANRWTTFLRNQIVPAPDFACEFEPRHGIRITTAKGHTDLVICYRCSQMSIVGSKPATYNPMFSKGTEAVINKLFDKLQIKRDFPKPSARQGTR